MLELFAIRHIPSGKLLPKPKSGKRGSTHVQINDKGLPNLFKKKHHAESCLKWWLLGKVTAIRDEDMEDIRIKPQPDRVASDMEVIPVFLAWR